MGSKNKAKKLKDKTEVKKGVKMEKKEAKEHIGTLKQLEEKDPEFYEFLKEHDKELLDFDEEDLDDNLESDAEEEEGDDDVAELTDAEAAMEEEPSKNVITTAMVDSWIEAVHSESKLAAVRSLLKAFRSACHYGDDSGDDPTAKFSTMSSSVFNKIMLFVLNEMDGILREILQFPSSGGKEEMVKDLMATKRWKKYNLLVKSYLGNSLHTLNQMTDNEMIAFMLRRLKYSSVFLAAFPALLRRYTKAALHFWGTGSGALPLVSFLFLRDCCIRLGPDCLDDCIKGMYKAYVLNCHFVNSTKLQHIQFLGNCFTEILRVDIPAAYQHAFVYIRQLVMILKEALSSPTKKKKTNGKGKDEHPKKDKGKEAPSSSSKKIEANSAFVNKKRTKVSLLPTDTVAESFLEDEKKSGTSPLSEYVATLRQIAQERSGALMESSVLIGDRSSKFGNKISSDDEYDDSETEENAGLLLSDHYSKQQKNVKKNIKHTKETTALDEDVVEDLILSSDEENPLSDSLEGDDDESEDLQEQSNKKRKHGANVRQGRENAGNRKFKKKKTQAN